MKLLLLFVLLGLRAVAALLIQAPVRRDASDVLPVDGDVLPSARLASSLYPAWAHSHMVWLNSGHNQSEIHQLVLDYLARDIPVGGVDIDSEWSTGVNDFAFNVKSFPNATRLVADLHQLGARTILWVTSVVDTDSPNHAFGLKHNFFLNNGTTVKWWHGMGSWLDYSNPAALAWWHSLMDSVIDIGISGWKCDGTDPFVFEYELLHGGILGHGGYLSEREYADAYYRDFFYYTRNRNPEALIWARPVNDYWRFAPRDVVFSGWVGDNDPTFDGMQWALNDMMHSAWANYVGFGSDTGGYRTGGPKPLGRTKELLIRWAQLSAFTPLFENGGDGEHRPWMFDQTNQTVDIYRQFVVFHTELSAFLLAGGTAAYAQNTSLISPLGTDVGGLYPTSFDFLLGVPRNIFVSPIFADGVRSKSITFPSGQWIDYFDNTTYAGGSTHTLAFPLERFPVYRRRNSLFPLEVSHPASLMGHVALRRDNALTVFLHASSSAGRASDTLSMHEWRAPGVVLTFDLDSSAQSLQLTASAYHRPLVFQLRGCVGRPSTVVAKGLAAPLPLVEACDDLAALTGVSGWCVGDEKHGELLLRIDAALASRGTVLQLIGFRALN
jgi:alpha-glucosidase (family GH31 glycosyl hydrolase)